MAPAGDRGLGAANGARLLTLPESMQRISCSLHVSSLTLNLGSFGPIAMCGSKAFEIKGCSRAVVPLPAFPG